MVNFDNENDIFEGAGDLYDVVDNIQGNIQGNSILELPQLEVPQYNDVSPLYNIDDPDFWLDQINGKIQSML